MRILKPGELGAQEFTLGQYIFLSLLEEKANMVPQTTPLTPPPVKSAELVEPAP
jgi:hypothetical protein